MKNYIFNLETTKIELHFDKAEYDALSAEQKSQIKSNYLWSNYGKCWVSRAKEPNLYWARKTAENLGFTAEQREGERLSFAEQMERKAERAEERADRYETYADNAEHRAAALQKPINDMHGDIAFFTQPIIAGHGGSQAFARRRQRMFDQYHKGFEEYRKSEYFKDRAQTARETASNAMYQDKGYLDRRIKECRKDIAFREERIVKYETALYALENGEQKKKVNGEPCTIDEVSGWIERELELMGVAQDKEAYLLNCLDALGGIAFSRENIKPGYIVKIHQWGECEIVSVGSVNVGFKILHGGAAGGCLQATYAEIDEVIKAEEYAKEIHPFKKGEVFSCKVWNGKNYAMQDFTVIKTTDSTITLQTGGEKPFIRKPAKWRQGNETVWRVSVADNFEGTIYKPVNSQQTA